MPGLRRPYRHCRYLSTPRLARMRAQTEDRQLAGNEYLGDCLLVSTPLEVGAGMDGILPGPTGGSEQRIEAISIGSGISIGDNLSPEFSEFCSVRHPPFY